MSRIEALFANKKPMIAYLTAGDGPTLYHLRALIEGGADLLEVGIPFSDPVADGPTIQKAMDRSLQAGTTPETVLELVAELKSPVPVILFTYFNPIQRDLKGFLEKAKLAGVDGVLVVDLPLEEAAEYASLCRRVGLDPIFVAAPSTPVERIELLSRAGKGFLYYACRKGTTGARNELPDDLAARIEEVKKASRLPVAVGFGIADSRSAKAVLEIADGCVVGSYLVQAAFEGKNLTQIMKAL
ncbi:MAG: tryptophan synthase subunit alpha [Verrucomicrobia bacterium]|nr:tryptophan synthase subunit alpha [Verrucomicrobiota bacterium]